MDCADKSISDDAADELIATDINAGDLTKCSKDAAGGSIATVNAGNTKNCAGILIKNNAEDGLIATTIDAENSTDCAEYTSGGLINAINYVNLMDFDDIMF